MAWIVWRSALERFAVGVFLPRDAIVVWKAYSDVACQLKGWALSKRSPCTVLFACVSLKPNASKMPQSHLRWYPNLLGRCKEVSTLDLHLIRQYEGAGACAKLAARQVSSVLL